MATITKIARESGTVYKARVRKAGQAGQISKTFHTRSAAERWARQFESQLEQDNAGLTNEAQRHTLADAIKKYRSEVLPTKRPHTQRPYRLHLTYWEQQLGRLRLSEVTAAKIAACRDALMPVDEDGQPLPTAKDPNTVARYLATLASVLTACKKRWHWLAVSPMQQVEKPGKPNSGTRYLSDDELHRLLAACRESSSPDLLLAVLLSIITGARQGEILGLRWQDVDMQAGVIRVRADAETTTKGGIRSLPIAAQVRPLLQARLDARQQGKVTQLRGAGLVFPSRVSANKPVSLRTPWETALRRANITGLRWHDMRHSCASFLARNGASLLEIGAVLGHRSANTTKRYAHLTEQHTHQLVRGMSDKLLGGRSD